MRKLHILILVFILIFGYSLSFGADQIKENIVKIYTTSNEHSYMTPWQMDGHYEWEGSGCIINDSLILTNAHVVSDQTFIKVKRTGQTKKYVARVRFVAHDCDLAALEVRDRSFYPDVPPLEVGELPLVGDEVAVYGYPNLAEQLTITKGIVSRVTHESYVHSSTTLLSCQIDAPIHMGNSGGPVISKGKIVGIAMMSGWSDEEGYMVSVPVIRHFLKDIEDDSYNGIPDLAIMTQTMENPSMRAYYGMDDGQSGILVRKVYPGSPVENVLLPDDVILSIDGKDIADDGTIGFRNGERTSYKYVVQNKHIGDTAIIQVLRDGNVHTLSVEFTAPSIASRLVPSEQYDVEPVYYIYGGFIFSPLTENLIMEFGNEWWYDAPPNLLYTYLYGEPTEKGEEVVVIVDVLSDEVNMGYEDLYYEIVSNVNGKRVRNMYDLVDAIKRNKDSFHILETTTGARIVLDKREADRSTKRILRQYKIPADRSENLRKRYR